MSARCVSTPHYALGFRDGGDRDHLRGVDDQPEGEFEADEAERFVE